MQSQAHPLIANIFSASFSPQYRDFESAKECQLLLCVCDTLLAQNAECSAKNIVKYTTKFDECDNLNTLRLMQMMKCKKGDEDCRRHNGPKGCLLSPKELLLCHVTSWSKFSFRISTKLQLPNHDQTGSKC